MTTIMTPVLLFILFGSLMAVPQPAIYDGPDDEDEGGQFMQLIAAPTGDIEKVNVNLTTLLKDGDIMPNMQRNADPCTRIGCKWPKFSRYVYVPVAFSSSYSSDEVSIIASGLSSFHESTCIRFIERCGQEDFLYFFPGSGCWSFLGRRGGQQQISLQKNGCLFKGIVQHELLHALGFNHEQVRSDRDKFVKILTQNIRDGLESNFQKKQTRNLRTRYDFNSIMHYSKFAFSKNGLPTIVAKSDPNLNFGRATEMSANDILRVNRLYRCRTTSSRSRRGN